MAIKKIIVIVEGRSVKSYLIKIPLLFIKDSCLGIGSLYICHEVLYFPLQSLLGLL